jgi:hypothetical protein
MFIRQNGLLTRVVLNEMTLAIQDASFKQMIFFLKVRNENKKNCNKNVGLGHYWTSVRSMVHVPTWLQPAAIYTAPTVQDVPTTEGSLPQLNQIRCPN